MLFRNVMRLVIVGLLTIGSLAARAWTDEEFLVKDAEYQQHCRNEILRQQNTCMCRFLKDRQAPQKLPKIIGASSSRKSSRSFIATAGASCVDGFAAGYPCMNADLMSFLPLQDIGARQTTDENDEVVVDDIANDIWGWTDAGSGREFALIGMKTGTSFVEITNPSSPIYLGVLPTHDAVSNWRDIKTFSDHAFIVAEGGAQGMQVFDLTQLLSLVDNVPTIFDETAHYSGFSNSHNVFVNEETGFAYAVGTGPIDNFTENVCPQGLHMVDVRDPTNPTYAGCFNADGYTHDLQCVIYNGPDIEHDGKEICFCCNADHVTIVDVSIKAAPVQLSNVTYENRGYTHQGWLTDDQGFFIFGDETDEIQLNSTTRTLVLNVGDLDNPFLSGIYVSPDSNAIDHNQYVVGSHLFKANYRAGLRVLEMNDITTASFTEVAYFDIYPSDNDAAFNGAWSNYPYFASGNVVVSGIGEGLFVIAVNLDEKPGLPSTIPLVPPTPSAFCFSGENAVTLEDGEDISIQSLSIGDKVLVHDGSYEPVYSFGHRNPIDYGDYLRLLTQNAILELSPDHMVYVGGSFIPASTVQMGDILSNGEAVSSINAVSRQGIYAPFTTSGTVVVSNVVCSSFISLQKDSAYLMLGTVRLPISWQWIGHTFEMPHRLLSSLGETYTEEGISMWVVAPKFVMQWILNQHVVVMSIIMIPAVMGLGLLFLIGQPWFVVVITLVSIFVTGRIHWQGKLCHTGPSASYTR
mmetsp:Transcript_7138/g.11852  ORF Transcript_7138/g.11852 Transcript_7138/m.11852 type:complete len:746 (-) Transcript_7138:214-2451(-)